MSMLSRLGAAIVAMSLVAGAAVAESPELVLEGKVRQPQRWTLEDLKKMPAKHADVSYQTERGPVRGSFTGVLLWSLIGAAGGIDDGTKNPELRHAIRITAKDGYVVVTSSGEIAPDFGAKAVIVAYERDGKPLDDFRIVMPGDKHGGRNVRDVVSINIE
jgi:DMSO/TMAO reductase YedYZ molybdopterin-dependent catalytic subunit